MNIKLTSQQGKDYEALLDINYIDLKGPLEVDFSEVKFFRPFTLTLLYGIFRLHEKLYPHEKRSCKPSHYQYENVDVFQYTQRIDFFKCCEELKATFSDENFNRYRASNFVPITQANSLSDCEKVAGDIIKIVFPHDHPGAQQAKYSLSELVGNSAQHSGSPIGAIMNAQLYADGELHGAILDAGVTIRGHLAGNRLLASQITSDEKAIELALIPGNSGAHNRKKETVERSELEPGYTNAGYGLSVCAEIAKRSGGFVHIISGQASYKVVGKNVSSRKIPGWPGTTIFYSIDCNNLPHIGEIIQEFDRKIKEKSSVKLRFDS